MARMLKRLAAVSLEELVGRPCPTIRLGPLLALPAAAHPRHELLSDLEEIVRPARKPVY